MSTFQSPSAQNAPQSQWGAQTKSPSKSPGVDVTQLAARCPMRSFRSLGAALVLIALATCRPGLAAELRVPTDYQTITAALAVADDEDRITVAAGTYSTSSGESFPLRLKKTVTLEAAPGAKPQLRGDGEHTVVLIETGGVTLRGLEITGGSGSEGVNHMDGGGVCIFVGPNERRAVTIADCDIFDNTCPSDETYDGGGGGIYCGGTYCTCFEIHLDNCTFSQNRVHGQGGGVFCALLSNVRVNSTLIENNTADDHGGGIFIDVFATVVLTETHLVENNCPGDPLKPDWGGKGGGLACESFGVFAATDCLFSQNTARYFGGGIFTRGGFPMDEPPCAGQPQDPNVLRCQITGNRANVSGGGAYVAASGSIEFVDSVFYWNDAAHQGGAVYVAGGATGGGRLVVAAGSCLEGNECGFEGGGVYLGQWALGTFESTEFLGNTALFDGGALFLGPEAAATLTNCLVTCNNSARGYGGGIRATAGSYTSLEHCSLVGNFAPRERSGLYLEDQAVADISNSILWRNAGGSVGANGATVRIVDSLNEDGADVTQNVIDGDPMYVGWGDLTTIHVDRTAPGPGTGTAANPYPDLQFALNGFDFRLADGSPCRRAASDGGNLGSDTGVGGVAGNVTALLDLAGGDYPIRGRSVIFTRGLQGTNPSATAIHHAVLGYIEDASIKDLSIESEEIFGGITLRADANFVECSVFQNTCLTDGGGIYVADGNCVLTDSSVLQNRSFANGGGIHLCEQVNLDLSESVVQNNAAADGGGLWTDRNTVSIVRDASSISFNSAVQGGGGYVSGILVMTQTDVTENNAGGAGGGLYVNTTADVNIVDCSILKNNAGNPGGGLMCFGETRINSTRFEQNTAQFGGAINIKPTGILECRTCSFSRNHASREGGVIWYTDGTSPSFQECSFDDNTCRNSGGVGRGTSGADATFSECDFIANRANRWHGGAFAIQSTTTRFSECNFRGNTANVDGGAIYSFGDDAPTFDHCTISESSAGRDGGAIYIMNSAHPTFSTVQVTECQATNNGGGIAVFGTAKPWFSQVTIRNCPTVFFGGGVYATDDTQCTFEECDFLNNQTTGVSADGGGASFMDKARGTFVQCVFQGNVANDDGGGVAADEDAALDLQNTLFVVNQAVNTGGAAYFTARSSGTFTNCTIISNTAGGDSGGGIYLDPGNQVKVDSSIIWQNSPDGIREHKDTVPVTTVTYSCVQGETVWPGAGNIAVDPLLDPTTHGLQDGSPCIDGGNPDPAMNDACQPPGKGTLRNDMGITGGPNNCRIIPPASVVGWWTFDRLVDGKVPDESGRGQSATLANGAALAPGRSGMVLHLDGGNDHAILNIGSLISTLTNSTFAGWVDFRNWGGPSQRIFDFGTGDTRYMYLSPRLSARGAMRFGITLTGEVDNIIDTDFTLPTDWHHVAVIFNTGAITLYLDGESVGSITSPLTPGSLGVTTENWLGKSRWPTHGYLNADLDDFRIYDKALSPQELADLLQNE